MTRRFPFVLAAALALASCAGQSQLPGAPGSISQAAIPRTAPGTLASTATAPAEAGRALFAASASPYFVDAYALPLSSTSMPIASIQQIDEPVPLAVGVDHLFVGSFDDGAVYSYQLPLVAGEAPDAAAMVGASAGSAPRRMPAYLMPLASQARAQTAGSVNIGTPSGLAAGRGYLYVAGSGASGRQEVSAYALPLRTAELPSTTLHGYGIFDFLGLATAGDTLYVASSAQGTIRAYPIPLTSSETAQFTIHIPPQNNAAIGVTASSGRLYVTNYSIGNVLVYALPYTTGEIPVKLDLRLANNGVNPFPYGVAVDDRYLWVSAGSIYQYKLPVTAGELPQTVMPFNGFAAGLAVYPKWPE